MCAVIFIPLTGSIYDQPVYDRSNFVLIDDSGIHWLDEERTPQHSYATRTIVDINSIPWYERSIYDQNKNSIHDSIESSNIPVGMAISYNKDISSTHIDQLHQLGVTVVDILNQSDSVLIGIQEVSIAQTLADLPDVVMVHQYGKVVFYGDIQTPNVKARNSSIYPDAALELWRYRKGSQHCHG